MHQALASKKRTVLKPGFRYFDSPDGELCELSTVLATGTKHEQQLTDELALNLAPQGAMYVQRVLVPKKEGVGRMRVEIDQIHPLDHPSLLPA